MIENQLRSFISQMPQQDRERLSQMLDEVDGADNPEVIDTQTMTLPGGQGGGSGSDSFGIDAVNTDFQMTFMLFEAAMEILMEQGIDVEGMMGGASPVESSEDDDSTVPPPLEGVIEDIIDSDIDTTSDDDPMDGDLGDTDVIDVSDLAISDDELPPSDMDDITYEFTFGQIRQLVQDVLQTTMDTAIENQAILPDQFLDTFGGTSADFGRFADTLDQLNAQLNNNQIGGSTFGSDGFNASSSSLFGDYSDTSYDNYLDDDFMYDGSYYGGDTSYSSVDPYYSDSPYLGGNYGFDSGMYNDFNYTPFPVGGSYFGAGYNDVAGFPPYMPGGLSMINGQPYQVIPFMYRTY